MNGRSQQSRIDRFQPQQLQPGTGPVSSTRTDKQSNNERRFSGRERPATTSGDPLETASDGELIDRFVLDRDEAAFRETVRRYGPLVLGVALRTVHDRQAAEDVFQATFLVLVEKASSLDDPSQVSAWLHGVAQRIARRLVDKRHRRREQSHPQEGTLMDSHASTDPFERVCQTRDYDVLGEELQRLPEKYRTPLVLKYLEELTIEQIAQRTGATVTAVEGRLKRGKKELRRRLARRGVTLGAALFVWSMARQVVDAAPVAELAEQTATIALSWNQPSSNVPPPCEPAAVLAQQEILAMSTLKLTVAGTLIGTTLLAAGLLAATSVAGDAEATASAASPAGTQAIDTSVTRTSEDRPSEQPIVPAGNAPDQATRVFRLANLDAEDAHRVLRRLYRDQIADSALGGGPALTLAVHSDDNAIVARGSGSVLDELGNRLHAFDQIAGTQPGTFSEAAVEPIPSASTYRAADDPAESRDFTLKTVYATDAAKALEKWFWGDAAESRAEQLRLVREGRSMPTFAADAETNVVTVTAIEDVMNEAELMLARIENGDVRLPPRVTEPSYRFDLSARSPGEERLRRALRTPTHTGFDEEPFYNALYMLAKRHNFQFYVDQAALDDVAVSLHDAPVSMDVGDVPVASVLDLMCRQVSLGSGEFGSSEVTYFIKNELLVVTTRDVAEQTMQVRTYDARPLNGNANLSAMGDLVDAIQTLAGPDSWTDQGGSGSIVDGGGTLTIRQSPLVHREIERLLEHLLSVAEKSDEPFERPTSSNGVTN